MPQALTANRLADGRVVYLDAGGQWSEWIEEAQVHSGEKAGAAAMAAAEEAVNAGAIVAPYLVDVVEEDGVIRPMSYREFIRANGPSVHPGFGKQAERAKG